MLKKIFGFNLFFTLFCAFSMENKTIISLGLVTNQSKNNYYVSCGEDTRKLLSFQSITINKPFLEILPNQVFPVNINLIFAQNISQKSSGKELSVSAIGYSLLYIKYNFKKKYELQNGEKYVLNVIVTPEDEIAYGLEKK